MTTPRIILHKHKADAVKRFHPWIFSGAIKKIDGEPNDGDLVEVYADSGEFLATGHYGTGSIAVKVLAFEPVGSLDRLLAQKLENAYLTRQQIGLANSAQTTCYRLVNAEGDGLPGLIIDWYNGTAVLQAHSLGMYQQRQAIVSALQQVYGDSLQAVYDKSASLLFKKTRTDAKDEYLFGSKTSGDVLEYGHQFLVDWETGQKTGFFIDQRENRQLLSRYVGDRTVLNTFCYSGGFSVYALSANAKQVHSVDSSAKAIELTEKNVVVNGLSGEHEAFSVDVFEYLKQCDRYDVIVLDPPAFAKNLSARHSAVMAYKRLNKQAFAKLNSGGILFTFSCSQVVGPEFFQGAVTAAAIESGRQIRILHQLTQPPDHPTSIYHPEGGYLKGLVLRVE